MLAELGVSRYILNMSDPMTADALAALIGVSEGSAIASVTAEREHLARAQADLAETKGRKPRGELVDASEVEAQWSGVLHMVHAGMLAVPSRCQQRLPHLTARGVSEIDREVREVLTDIGSR